MKYSYRHAYCISQIDAHVHESRLKIIMDLEKLLFSNFFSIIKQLLNEKFLKSSRKIMSMLGFRCHGVRFDCERAFNELTEDKIVLKVIENGKNEHNMHKDDFTPLSMEKVKHNIQRSNDDQPKK